MPPEKIHQFTRLNPHCHSQVHRANERQLSGVESAVATVAKWPEAAVQTSEKTSIQRPVLPDSGSQSRLERHRSPWAIRAAGLSRMRRGLTYGPLIKSPVGSETATPNEGQIQEVHEWEET